jgi:hypothetical protein
VLFSALAVGISPAVGLCGLLLGAALCGASLLSWARR